ncbi:hypothetical protein PV327_000399 [Microctonus hyperodae]|uniref:Nucleotide exchange factor SIL1 n=2 Tax=Microctonus hyperodae TaxID=165561 RepID=A0AA39G711_MICHY|nr:hypothetical protein PV327_000399 [Microctonus hyperodae]
MQYLRFFIYLLMLLMLNLLSVSGEKNESIFLPTNEWQPVKKGQPIPSGLHVRYNFQTGITEAKLLSAEDEKKADDEKISNWLALHSDALDYDDDEISAKTDATSNTNLKMSLQELKAKLKNIKSEDNNSNKLKNNFRSYEELKKDLKEIEMNVTTDSELLKNLFNEFEVYEDSIVAGTLEKNQIDDIVQIFNDFEYLLHQVDNAQIFADMNGMVKIISPCLNTTNEDIKMEALRVFGTAVQSNPKVQLNALKNHFVQKLLHLLTSNKNKLSLSSRCLFALSALVRQFPAAQKILFDHGGLAIFSNILKDGHLQLQLRVMKLITDLAIERENIKKTEDTTLREQKIREYVKTEFGRNLITNKYCKALSNTINHNIQQSLSIDSTMEMYDFFEVTLENMITLSPICKYEFRNPENNLLKMIKSMMDYYSVLNDTQEPEDIEMFENLVKQITRLRTSIFENTHDEL